MRQFLLTSDNGCVWLGDFYLSWGNKLTFSDGQELPGFFTIGWGNTLLEFGDVDQGRPGIYVTRCGEGDVCRSVPVLLLPQQQTLQ